MVESHLQFKLNGRIHTKNVFLKDLDFALNGKKIVKSIQSRLDNYANFLFKNKGSQYSPSSFAEFKSSVKLKKRDFFIKFINITQSFGIKIEVAPQGAKKVNLLTANFNKIVKANIRIKSFLFTFNVPSKDLMISDIEHSTYSPLLLPSKPTLCHSTSTTSADPEPRLTLKKLSTKSKSYCAKPRSTTCQREQGVLVDKDINRPSKTGFEHFLLASTPFVTQVLEGDSLAGLLLGLEDVADVGIEVKYWSCLKGKDVGDVFLPTLKELHLAYVTDGQENKLDSFKFTEEEPLYQRMPFVDKIEEISQGEGSQALNVSLPCLTTTSWIAIEWFLHSSNATSKNGSQKSITVYYALDFSKPNAFLPITYWQVNDPD